MSKKCGKWYPRVVIGISVITILPALAIADMISRHQVNSMRKILEKDNVLAQYFEPIREWESKPLIIRIFTNPSWNNKSNKD